MINKEYYKNIFDQFDATAELNYEIHRYSSSLKRLILSIKYKKHNQNGIEENENKFLLFSGVFYIQALTYWSGSNLEWFEDVDKILQDINLITGSHKLKVVGTRHNMMNMFIVFSHVEIFNKFPKLVGEYSF